jgi:four helix bundle suffix protein
MQPYKKLFTFWFSVIIYDRTVEFCEREIRSWKLKEQMNGAARSGKQNIVEGSDNLTTSLKLCIGLTGVAKSSLEELTGDLEDFLRQRNMKRWEKNDPRVVALRTKSATTVRHLSDPRNLRDETTETQLINQLPLPENPEEAANFLLTLCHQATYLLNNQVASLKKKHEREGGLTEELYRKMNEYRSRFHE